MASNPQSRKWMLTINNPQDCGLDHSGMQSLLNLFCPDYFCLADETATTGTFHTHIFIYSKSPIRFSTLKNRFPTAHIEKALGSAKDNRDYIRKEGRTARNPKPKWKAAFMSLGTFQMNVRNTIRRCTSCSRMSRTAYPPPKS